MIAEVLINSTAKDLNKTYDYLVPTDLKDRLKIGSRVFVPFGGKKVAEGFVIELKKESEFANKELIKIEDNLLTLENVKLAKLMAKRYFCNISDCINLMLPPGDKNKQIIKRIKEKTGNFVYLKVSTEEIDYNIETEKIKSDKHIRILEFLKRNNGVHILDLENLLDVSRGIIKTLEKNNYIEVLEKKIERNPFINKNIVKDKALPLTEEQQKAFERIKDSKYKQFLIYGVTGSRKDRSLFTTYTKCFRKGKNSYCISSRNIFNSTNGR